jgi:glutaredoxin 2
MTDDLLLYLYHHCPFCCRVQMLAGLKGLDLPLRTVLEDDVATPTALVGRKVVPILRRRDGSHMAESMDIVDYLDHLDGTPLLPAGPGNAAITDWCAQAFAPALAQAVARFIDADLPELATDSARAAYRERETRAFGDLGALRADAGARAQVASLLATLEPIIAAPGSAIERSDIVLLPILRSLSIVAGLALPARVAAWYADRLQRSGLDDFSAQAR